MGGVTDEQHTTHVPCERFQPFDRSAVDLLVLVQTGEIFLHLSAEPDEAVAQALGPAPQRVLQTRPGYVAKTISAPVPDRAQTKEASVAEPKLQARQASRTLSEVRDSTAG